MANFAAYTLTDKTITFTNGKSFAVYSKQTKAGLRYFYFSPSNAYFMAVSKNDIR
jgi:hypothetical protein